jgi:hypothetical protein
MAVYKIFPEKDTTVYSEFASLNTGLDSILELQNIAPPSTSSPQVARTLLQFPLDKMTEVTNIIYNTNINPIPGPVPPGSLPNGVYSASLKLFVANATNLPDNYTLYCHAVSQSWQAGRGRFLYDPPYNQDCSWYNRDNSNSWPTSNFFTNTTASFNSNTPGGSTWWINYVGSQSFEINTTKDTNINITSIVQTFTTPGFLDNNGLILKFEPQYEFNTSSSYSLKFFSKDTHTIYLPQLEFSWDDSVYVTGSLSVLNNQNIAVTLGNNLGAYKIDDICQFRINARPIYPSRQFVTQSIFTLNSSLPSSSYYAIQDLDTEEYVINFSEESTKISCDPSGNFFTLYTAGFQPERYYKILIKSTFFDGSSVVYNNDYIFKINK